MPETLRVASVQIPIFNTPEENLGRILQGVSEAAEQGARIVLFPETALSGFVPEAINALDWEALKKAEGAIANAAESHNIYVLYGSVTDSGKERPFNSAVLVGPDGVEITRYHKMVPERHFEPGDHLELFEVDGVPCTMIICHDERYPELVRIPVLGGARVLFYISYEINSVKSALYKQEGYRAQLMARAMENGIWAVQSNGIGSPPGSDGGSMSLGHSRIIEPGGGVIAEAPGLTETMLVEDIRPAAA
ncbi:MAG: carbon-nitrogen hydrolase family protein, partial [Candidatus Hydrogenedentes bacterium]|nr:carbon-nitrogen hydrolase family protein [Candidatus Hydrogenedentota bacterium]